MFPDRLNWFALGYVETEAFLNDGGPQEALELNNPSKNPVQTSTSSGPDRSGSFNPIQVGATSQRPRRLWREPSAHSVPSLLTGLVIPDSLMGSFILSLHFSFSCLHYKHLLLIWIISLFFFCLPLK